MLFRFSTHGNINCIIYCEIQRERYEKRILDNFFDLDSAQSKGCIGFTMLCFFSFNSLLC